MDGLAALQEAIRTVPVPGAPPRLSKEGAAVGLAFLDTALRQNHVRRLTERLKLIEHRAARCTIEVDISLGLLDDGQREAGILYRKLRNRTISAPADPRVDQPGSAGSEGNIIWVPVSRLSRRIHSPVDVRNESGVKLPRLTEYETSRLLASALYRLLRAILSAQEDANQPVTREKPNLHAFLHNDHESRWLIQAALLTLLTERSKPAAAAAGPAAATGQEDGYRDGCRPRQTALGLLARYRDALHDYASLLDIALNDYLLVVALDNCHDEHLMVFDSPLHVVEDKRRRPWPHRPIRLAGGAYWVQYTTELPVTMRAYHLAAETEPGLRIDTMYLTSDADRAAVDSVRADLMTLSDQLCQEGRAPADERARPAYRSCQRVLDLELETCLRQLGELVRRRRWEASQAGIPFAEDELRTVTGLAGATTAEPGSPAAMSRSRYGDGRRVTPEQLSTAAAEIVDQELFRDFDLENDPASDRAHAYWRRDPSPADVDRSIKITASMFIRDTSGARSGAVILYTLAVVAISWLFGAFLFDTWLPQLTAGPLATDPEPDAVLAVLLLVPGFLYTRLNLPPRQSIAGRLRLVPRVVAYVTIGCTVLLAGTIAASDDPSLIRWALRVATLLPLLAIVAMILLARAVREGFFFTVSTAPKWVSSGVRAGARDAQQRHRFLPGWATHRRLHEVYAGPDAAFRTSGVDHEHE